MSHTLFKNQWFTNDRSTCIISKLIDVDWHADWHDQHQLTESLSREAVYLLLSVYLTTSFYSKHNSWHTHNVEQMQLSVDILI